MVVDKNSLLFRLASIYGQMPGYDIHHGCSICQYNKYFMKGFCICIAIVALTSLWLSILLAPLFYGILALMYPNVGYVFNEFSVCGLVVDGLAILVLLAVWIYPQIDHRPVGKSYKEPSQISLHWTSFKEKVCFKVTFK